MNAIWTMAQRTKTLIHDSGGGALVTVGAAAFVLLGAAAIAVDLSFEFLMKSRLQGAADAAATGAVSQLGDDDTVIATAIEFAQKNMGSEANGEVLVAADVSIGNWDGTNYVAGGLPENAVRIFTRRSAENGNPVTTFLASILGFSDVDISAVSIATPPSPTFASTPGSSESRPYSVSESNAVDNRGAPWPFASRWKRSFVVSGRPSPANIRIGSSSVRRWRYAPSV